MKRRKHLASARQNAKKAAAAKKAKAAGEATSANFFSGRKIVQQEQAAAPKVAARKVGRPAGKKDQAGRNKRGACEVENGVILDNKRAPKPRNFLQQGRFRDRDEEQRDPLRSHKDKAREHLARLKKQTQQKLDQISTSDGQAIEKLFALMHSEAKNVQINGELESACTVLANNGQKAAEVDELESRLLDAQTEIDNLTEMVQQKDSEILSLKLDQVKPR
jgi:hypothetical protein